MSQNSLPATVPDRANLQDPADVSKAYYELVTLLRQHCPWDRKQTHASISQLLIEECYEVLEAIQAGNMPELKKELGDVLLHVVMHSVIAEQAGEFTFADVVNTNFEKLVHRHPYVFGEEAAGSAEDVKKTWASAKMKEGRKSILDGVPAHMPGLLRAQRVQEKAASVGFDWDNASDVWSKVQEEVSELQEASTSGSADQVVEEFGDVLFSLVNASRFAGISAEEAMQKANAKFSRRFQALEQLAREKDVVLGEMTLAEMDELWDEVKANERGN